MLLTLAAGALLACGGGGKTLPRAEADRPTAPTSAGEHETTAAPRSPVDTAPGPAQAPATTTKVTAESAATPSPDAGITDAGPLVSSATGEGPSIPLWELDALGKITAAPAPGDAPRVEGDDPDELADEDGTGQTWITHTVVPRETIELLAIRYRSDPGKIRSWNKLPSGAKAKPRTKLRILARRTPPPRQYIRHVVAPEETWGRVAHRYGVDPSDLRAINIHRVKGTIEPGEELDVWYDPTILAAIEGDAPPPGPAAEVSPGAYAVGRPHEGRLVNGTRIPESGAYELRYPGSSWGTTNSVRALVTGIHSWRETSGYGGRLAIGAMSRERGRPIGGHLSHQCGRDVDVRLPLYEHLPQNRTPLGRRVDWWALWQLIVALEETGEVYRIFLDYKMQKRLYKAAKEHGVDKEARRRLIQFPRGRGSGRGLIRHSPGHDRHFHARFRCADFEVECLDA